MIDALGADSEETPILIFGLEPDELTDFLQGEVTEINLRTLGQTYNLDIPKLKIMFLYVNDNVRQQFLDAYDKASLVKEAENELRLVEPPEEGI